MRARGLPGPDGATGVRDRLIEAFKTGKGIGWHGTIPTSSRGTERFFRPGTSPTWYQRGSRRSTVWWRSWSEADVADVGCGRGASTILMAKAFPSSRFTGIRLPRTVNRGSDASGAGREAGASAFHVAAAKDYPGTYDLVCHFDCLHDMGDPVGAARHTLESLKADGTWMLVEPFASDDVGGNLTPVGRCSGSASTFICTPTSLSQEVGTALGAQAGGPAPRGRAGCRFHAVPASDGDTVQPRARGESLGDRRRDATTQARAVVWPPSLAFNAQPMANHAANDGTAAQSCRGRSARRGLSSSEAGDFLLEVQGLTTAFVSYSPQCSRGTRYMTSNSMPSGSWAYSDFETPWSLMPPSASSSVSFCAISARSSIVATSHARW